MLLRFSLPNGDSFRISLRSPRGPLQHRCHHCFKHPAKLLKCSGCRAVLYCSRDHQVKDRKEHREICTKLFEYRRDVDEKEQAIRKLVPVFTMTAEKFQEEVCGFWDVSGVKDYMASRMSLAMLLSLSDTLDGITEAVGHLSDMLQLCRLDYMEIRHVIPPLLLMLDRDQQSYDFVKWWETFGREYELYGSLAVLHIPYLHKQGANVLEDIGYLKREDADFRPLSWVLLLKMKLLVDILNIQFVRQVCVGRLPSEVWSQIEGHVVRSDISPQLLVGKPYQELRVAKHKLEVQVADLIGTLASMKPGLFTCLLQPSQFFKTKPQNCDPVSYQEISSYATLGCFAWENHVGIMELLREIESERKDS